MELTSRDVARFFDASESMIHKQVLARLSFALHDKDFKRLIVRRASAAKILMQAGWIDAGIARAAAIDVERIGT